MKVFCFFNGRSRLGGVERRIGRTLNQIKKTSNVDIRIVFLLFEPLEKVIDTYRNVINDCVLEFVGFERKSDLFKYLQREKPDTVLYTGGYGSAMPFIIASKLFVRNRLLLSVTTNTSTGQFSSLREKLLFDLSCRLSTQIDCLYPEATPRLINKYQKKKVTTTPCPSVDLDIFKPQNKERVISFISRWERIKNPELFVSAIEYAQKQIRDNEYKVLMGGNSKSQEYTESLLALIRSKGLDDLIVTPGFVKTEKYLPNSEVFLSLQDITNYPSQALLEAISSGCFIVATDVGDTRILVKDNFGVLCEHSVSTIGQALIDYMNKTTEEKALGSCAARTFAEEHFNEAQMREYYQDLIGIAD